MTCVMNRSLVNAARTLPSRQKFSKQASVVLTALHSRHQLSIRNLASSSSWDSSATTDRPIWSEEWKSLGLGAKLVNDPPFPKHLMFVQVGFGVDQHGEDDATKASVRAVRNAIEFNSIPGVIEHIPGGRQNMLIHVKLGVPSTNTQGEIMPVDVLHVAKVFPYGKLLPIEIVRGGLDFSTGRVVEELGDTHDRAVCVVACISIGYGSPNNCEDDNYDQKGTLHKTYSTRDGY